jgi:hypothetical protein
LRAGNRDHHRGRPDPGRGAEHHEVAVALDLLADENQTLDVFGDSAYSAGECCHALEERPDTGCSSSPRR